MEKTQKFIKKTSSFEIISFQWLIQMKVMKSTEHLVKNNNDWNLSGETLTPAARLLASLSQLYRTIFLSSMDLDPSISTRVTGRVTILSPPALLTGALSGTDKYKKLKKS